MSAEDASALLDLPDLAAARFGGSVMAVSDEFFGPALRLIAPTDPVSRKGDFDEHGQWMDGWETRRRRGARRSEDPYDWALVKLGAPGVVRAVVADTAYFSGNQMESVALDGVFAAGNPGLEDLLAAQWTELLPPSPTGPSAKHVFAPATLATVTHVRLRAAPDGGLARLRLHGTALPDPREVDGLSVDLAAATTGGVVTSCSDMHFGRRSHLIEPGEARTMGEGWETRRRRGPGADWVVLRLAAESMLAQLSIDTRHFLGNAPDSCDIEVSGDGEAWVPLITGLLLQPDQVHVVRIAGAPPASWLRLTVHPDGGVARLRAVGVPTPAGRTDWALRWTNALPEPALHALLLSVCGSSRWAVEVAQTRPWTAAEEFRSACASAWEALGDDDRLEALAAHPRIGDRTPGTQESREQARVAGAPDELLDRIARRNADYEARFGFTFVVRASGRSAEQMLALLEDRLANPPAEELLVAGAQQWEIMSLRVDRLLGGAAR